MTDTQITSVSNWKKGTTTKSDPTELPSGNRAYLRKVSIQTLVQTGQIPNTLMGPIRKALGSGHEEMDPAEMRKIMEDPKALNDMFAMVDLLTVNAFVEPKVHAIPYLKDPATHKVILDGDGNPTPAERDPELLYVDEVDLDDKMYLFNWMVGGTSSLEPFRDQQGASVESVPASENVESAAKPPGEHFG